MTHEELTAFYGDLAVETKDYLKSPYVFAKRRFRCFTNNRPHQQRFPRRLASSSWDLRLGGKGKGKHGHSGKKGHYAGFPLGPSDSRAARARARAAARATLAARTARSCVATAAIHQII